MNLPPAAASGLSFDSSAEAMRRNIPPPLSMRSQAVARFKAGVSAISSASRRTRRNVIRKARALATFLASGNFLIAILVLGGIGMSIGGVHTLLGAGWTLIAGGVFAFALAGLLVRGGHE